MRLRTLFKRGERGQAIIIVALLLPVLLGMAGMAVDIGSYASERRTLQNAADSIALAAAPGASRSDRRHGGRPASGPRATTSR